MLVIWDNGPAHRGEPIRTFLAIPDARLRLVPLPGYSPDDNADEAIWAWVRDDVTAHTCLGRKAKVREQVGAFLAGLGARPEEVKRRRRTALQAEAATIEQRATAMQQVPQHGEPTPALL